MASNSHPPVASIVVPTRMRPGYLEVALASIAPQRTDADVELIVVDDAGPSQPIRRLAERFGASYEPHSKPLGLNVARNTGVERSSGELVVFVDDDVEACAGWLGALLAAAREHPDIEVFTGPIVPLLEGKPPHSCGREGPPITSLDLGPRDTRTRYAWGANMAIRRGALERIGPFDISLKHGGDEQEWQERLARDYARRTRDCARQAPRAADDDPAQHAGDAPAVNTPAPDTHAPDALTLDTLDPDTLALYVAGAGLRHRRSAADARLLPLCRAAHARGRAARRFDSWRGEAPTLMAELRTLAGCVGHVVRRRCPAGMTMVAHSAGRVEEACRGQRIARTSGEGSIDRPRPPASATSSSAFAAPPDANGRVTDDFLSGESGAVGGLDGLLRAGLDRSADAFQVLSGRRRRLNVAAGRTPSARDVLVLGVERPQYRALAQGAQDELSGSRHHVEIHRSPAGRLGKFENLNLLLESHPADDYDWLFVVDDDIVLPHRFLDRFLFLAERFRLDLAQPAHHRASHAAWQVTRRRPGSVARETSFVEIGPVTAFAHSTFSALLPFPELRMGWGLDMHWGALARERGLRCGVIDATPIRHRAAPAASAYSREQALAEARAFLEHRPHLHASEAQRTLTVHRRW